MIFSCSHVTVQRTAWLSSAPCNWVAWLDVIGEGPESPALFSGMDLRWEVLVVKLVCLFISSGYVISFSKPMTWSLYIASTLIGFAAAGECWIKHFPFGNLSISASLSHLTCIILSLYQLSIQISSLQPKKHGFNSRVQPQPLLLTVWTLHISQLWFSLFS